MNGDYPVQFAVDYPDRDLNRLTTAFRIFTVIPIAIVLEQHRRLHSGGGYGRQIGRDRHRSPSAAPACCSYRRC